MCASSHCCTLANLLPEGQGGTVGPTDPDVAEPATCALSIWWTDRDTGSTSWEGEARLVVGAGRGNDDKVWRVHAAITVAPGAEAIGEVSPGTGELVTPGGVVWGWEGEV